jgi:hypothetical protein
MLRAAAIPVMLTAVGSLTADQLTVRYPAAGSVAQYGNGAEHRTWWGQAAAAPGTPRPTHVVTYRHPYTGQNVSVPMTLPESTPRIVHATDRIVYDYGSYTVTSRFLPDGSVDVIYNSGLFRPLRLR